jgi:K+-sensing histidine kinase KdpD
MSVQVEQMRKDLAGMLSHDLGNPVLSIQKAMHLLADEALGPMNADQREVAGLALETSRQLYGMVTDFLDIYRYENHRLVLRKTDFDNTMTPWPPGRMDIFPKISAPTIWLP